jgi:SAM-dependent methyltransferase
MNREHSSVVPVGAPIIPALPDAIPEYLARTYTWAYLSRRTLPWLDRPLVVAAILWGNSRRLMQAAVAEFSPGMRVMQAACVYGDFSRLLADRLGPCGQLTVVDVAEIQLANLRHKLRGVSHLRVVRADLSKGTFGVAPGSLDGVCCFFLLHEVPEEMRRRIVDHLLAAVRIGGKVVFTDYHRPHRWHPLRPVMAAVFRLFEPYATSLQEQDISSLSAAADNFSWHQTTKFGGLYQQLTATRIQ